MSSNSAMLLGRVCGNVGAFVGRRPIVATLIGSSIFVLSILGLVLSPPGLVLSFDQGYTTSDAPSIRELQSQVDFFGNRGKPWYMALFAEPRNQDASMLDPKTFYEFEKFYNRVKKTLPIKEEVNRTFHYMDYCEPMCDFNQLVFTVYDFDFAGVFWWPLTRVFGYEANIGKHFFKRTMGEKDRLLSTKLEALYFMVFINSSSMAAEMEEFERLVQREVVLHNSNSNMSTFITQHGAQGMELEIKRGTGMASTRVIIGGCLTILIALGAFVILNKVHGRCTGLVLPQGAVVCLVPIMALTSTIAVFGIFGRHLNTLIALSPVLIVAAALDGMLHLHNCWLNESNTRKDSVSEVLREVFAVALPPISLILSISFGLLFGGLFPIEEFANLSLFLGLSLIFVFFYQIFIFTPAMVWCAPVPCHLPLSEGCDNRCSTYNSIAPARLASFVTRSSIGRIFCCLLFVSLVVIPSIFGTTQIEGNLDYRELLPQDSPNKEGVRIMSDIVWPEFLHILYIIHKPPNFEDPMEFRRFRNFMKEAESVPMAMGTKANMIWLDHFMQYSNTPDDAESLNMTIFPNFITDGIYKAWASGIRYNVDENGRANITRMVYMVAVNGTTSLADKARVMQHFRRISSRYPEIDAVPFDTEVGMADVITQIPSVLTTIPTIMFSLCFAQLLLVTGNVSVAVVATLATISVFYACVATSALFGVALNPFSVAFLLISAAMAPRFVTFISYFYQKSLRLIGKAEDEALVRLQETLRRGLLPTILSSIVGAMLLLPVLFTPVTIFRQVAGSNALLLFFGLLHSFLLLPAFLSALPRQLTGTSCLLS